MGSQVAEHDVQTNACESSAQASIGGRVYQFLRSLDSDYFPQGVDNVRGLPKRVELDRCIPFLFLHAGCLGVFFVGISWTAVVVAVTLFFIRGFAITGFYHRYFSHRSFRTSRPVQFLFAVIGTASVQRGPLWWAAHHREHHAQSDKPGDVHSPGQGGFWWAHIGWITSSANMPTNYRRVADWAKYPELMLLNRFDWTIPVALAVGLFALGTYLQQFYPALGTNGPQLLVWGFFVSTVYQFHVTAAVNSAAHIWGSRRYETEDDSRNNWLVALLGLGEGWHNNHHRFMSACRQGFFWWEFDLTYCALKVMSWVGLVWDLRPVPAEILAEGRADRHDQRAEH